MNKKSFILGALVGALVAAVLHVAIFRWQRPFHRPLDPQRRQRMILRRFSEDLSLNQQQVGELAPILSHLQAKMLKLKLAQAPEIEKLVTEADREIAQYLSPEQEAKLEQLRARFKKEHELEAAFVKSYEAGNAGENLTGAGASDKNAP